jgi:DNA helicase II / ATP-dependent DNA helicase PcrA
MTEKHLILGPPGTGKTTYLLNIVEEAIAKGIPPQRIAFLSFTKAAADEAISRACVKFGLETSDFPYFRTLHSLCYMIIGLKDTEVMKDKHWREFGANCGYEITTHSLEFPNSGHTEGDQLMKLYQLSRARQHTIIAEAELQKSSQLPHRIWGFYRELEKYKQANGVMDFHDFLDHVDQPLPVDVMIVDEAQDLTRQQWSLLEKLSATSSQLYIAGDDDQAIFEWAGADIPYFLNIKATTHTVLDKSWRLGKQHVTLCSNIANKIANRYQKTWTWSDKEHGCRAVSEHSVPALLESGDWLLLARTRMGLDGLIKSAKECGRVYAVNDKWSTDNPITKAIVEYTALQKGSKLTLEQMKRVCSFSDITINTPESKRDYFSSADAIGLVERKPWFDALKLSPQQIVSHRALLRRGESLSRPGNVRIATIHTVKGAEADNVVLVCNPTSKRQDDGEKRVWYVGASRAKSQLFLINPESNRLF